MIKHGALWFSSTGPHWTNVSLQTESDVQLLRNYDSLTEDIDFIFENQQYLLISQTMKHIDASDIFHMKRDIHSFVSSTKQILFDSSKQTNMGFQI